MKEVPKPLSAVAKDYDRALKTLIDKADMLAAQVAAVIATGTLSPKVAELLEKAEREYINAR